MAGGAPSEFRRPASSRKFIQMNVIGFGDNIIDRFVDRRILYPGGNALNFSVFASRLGAVSDYVGVFGTDPLADHLRASLLKEGVGIGRSVAKSGPSGWANVRLEDGERVFGAWNGGGVTTAEPMVLEAGQLEYIAGARLLHSGAYSRTESELPKLVDLPTLVSFDLSSGAEHRDQDYLSSVCPYVDLALVSCADLSEQETRSLMATIAFHGADLVLGTMGTAGSILFDGADYHRGHSVPVDPDEVKDTMGCGDAYLTAFALELLGAGWTKASPPDSEAIALAFKAGAVYAAQQCLTEGSFGYGIPFQTDESPAPETTATVG